MRYGYLRTINRFKDYNKQKEHLDNLKCVEIVEEDVHFDYENSKLKELINRMEAGDVLAVYSLKVLGMGMEPLLDFLEELDEKGLAIKIIDIKVDTSKQKYKNLFEYVKYIKETNHQLRNDRVTYSSKNRERKYNKYEKRKRGASISFEKENEIKKMREKGYKLQEIADTLGVSYPTVQKYAKLHLKK
ncbi:recombinase family protein [Macrococcus bovicus]|uniref:recombinase family protein n=1 Tax=Macrococcus bovicus TaxID=69968 RepID=UPI0025A656AA|nr:recombinase family protein [Macrococcus bovicus]WJP96748.1 recombinase family protein [Macrococcus bovicus]